MKNETDRVGTTIISNRMLGLDFGLGETADMIRASIKSLAQAEIAPRAEDIDANNAFPRHF